MVKVGDWIEVRNRPGEVYQVDSIEISIDETYLADSETPMALRALLAASPFVRLMAPDWADYPDGFTQRPADFRVLSEEELKKIEEAHA
jgi:hypothetical protein